MTHPLVLGLEAVVLVAVVGVIWRQWRGLRGDRRSLALLAAASSVGCRSEPTPADAAVALGVLWIVAIAGVCLALAFVRRWPDSRDADESPELPRSMAMLEAVFADQDSRRGAVSAAKLKDQPIDYRGPDVRVTRPTDPVIAAELREALQFARLYEQVLRLQQVTFEQADLLVQLTTQLHSHCDRHGFGVSQRVFHASHQRAKALRDAARPAAPTPEASS